MIDHVDSKHALSVLVGSTPLAAIRGRATLVGSEVATEWAVWATGCPAIQEAVDEVAAAIAKLQTIIGQGMK